MKHTLRCHDFGGRASCQVQNCPNRGWVTRCAEGQNRASPRGVAAKIADAPERGAGSPESGRGAPGVFRGSDLAGDRGRRSFASDSGRIPKLHRVPAPPRQPPRLRDATVQARVRTAHPALYCPAPGSHPSKKRLEPAPPCAGRFVARLANTASIGCTSLRAIDDSGSHRTRVSLCYGF